jgi:hypothetical protein
VRSRFLDDCIDARGKNTPWPSARADKSNQIEKVQQFGDPHSQHHVIIVMFHGPTMHDLHSNLFSIPSSVWLYQLASNTCLHCQYVVKSGFALTYSLVIQVNHITLTSTSLLFSYHNIILR